MRLILKLLFPILLSFSLMAFATLQEAEQTSNTQTATQSTTSTDTSENKPQTSENSPATDNNEPIPLGSNEINAPIDALLQQQNDLKHYLPNKTIKPLQLGMQEHLVIVEENKTSLSKGVMILLPNWHQNATGSDALNQLREAFPEQGWTTLTIQPPMKPENYPSNAIDKDTRQQDNQKILTEYQEQLAQIISQVNQQATEYPGVIITIAEGSHGSVLTSIYQRQLSPSPSALVLLSSSLATIEDNRLTAEHLTELSFPVLDLMLYRDNNNVDYASELRKQAVKQQLKSFYRQQVVHNQIPSQYPKTTLIKRINGWLASLGW